MAFQIEKANRNFQIKRSFLVRQKDWEKVSHSELK